MIQAIILSGGRGTRLHPLTLEIPKPMLPVGNIPHLQHLITLIKHHGINDIILSTGYLSNQIEEYFGDGTWLGVSIKYREDGDILLGTAGAIKNCEDLISSECKNIVVVNGDILTNINLTNMIKEHDNNHAHITIALANVEDPSQYGVARLGDHNRILDFIEKPSDMRYGSLINAGIYVIRRSVLDSIHPHEFSMVEYDIFPKFAQKGLLYGYKEPFYWLDIGTLERYGQAQVDFYKKIFSGHA